MTNETTVFTVQYEGETVEVTVTEVEDNDNTLFYAEIPGNEKFEIFLSENDMWVSNDEVAVDEDLIFLIGDTFESLQP